MALVLTYLGISQTCLSHRIASPFSEGRGWVCSFWGVSQQGGEPLFSTTLDLSVEGPQPRVNLALLVEATCLPGGSTVLTGDDGQSGNCFLKPVGGSSGSWEGSICIYWAEGRHSRPAAMQKVTEREALMLQATFIQLLNAPSDICVREQPASNPESLVPSFV